MFTRVRSWLRRRAQNWFPLSQAPEGFFGPPPSEQGREPRMLMMQRNPEAVTLGSPLTPEQAQAIQAVPAATSKSQPAQPHKHH